MKTLMKATSMCFMEKGVYTQEVLAVVMQQLMDQNPLPTLLMRTVLQSLSLYPRLSGFVMNILQRLIVKQVNYLNFITFYWFCVLFTIKILNIGVETKKSLGRFYQMLSTNKATKFCCDSSATCPVFTRIVEHFSRLEDATIRACKSIL